MKALEMCMVWVLTRFHQHLQPLLHSSSYLSLSYVISSTDPQHPSCTTINYITYNNQTFFILIKQSVLLKLLGTIRISQTFLLSFWMNVIHHINSQCNGWFVFNQHFFSFWNLSIALFVFIHKHIACVSRCVHEWKNWVSYITLKELCLSYKIIF